jgi:hypothetical protein
VRESPLRQAESHIESPGEPSRALSASAASLQQGSFDAELVASASCKAPRKHPFPGFGPGRGEARSDGVRTAPLPVTAHRAERRLRPMSGAQQGHRLQRTVSSRGFGQRSAHATATASSIRLRCRRGLAPFDDGGADRAPSGARTVTGTAAERFEPLGGFAPQIHRLLPSVTEASTSRCGHTLEWHPRAGEVERSECLHLERSVRGSENPKADSCNTCGKTAKGESSTNTALRSSDSISVAQVNHMRGPDLAGDSLVGSCR